MQVDGNEEQNASPTSESGTSPPKSYTDLDSRRFGVMMRSSSPAKRSASEREEDEQAHSHPSTPSDSRNQQRSPKKTYQEHLSPMPNRFKPVNQAVLVPRSPSAEAEVSGLASNDVESHHVPRSHASGRSDEDSEMSNIAGTSGRPSSTTADFQPIGKAQDAIDNVPSIDEQVNIIQHIVANSPLEEGVKGYAISNAWLLRVTSRSTQGLNEGHPKSVREGEIGPVDNSDIVANGVDHFHGEIRDSAGNVFVPLRAGLQMSHDVEFVPLQAWELIVKWYGLAERSHVVVRTVHNTSAPGVSHNLMYEMYPPMFTLQKLRNDAQSVSITSLKEKELPAVTISASRSDTYQSLLKRAKVATCIDSATRVRAWKLFESSLPNNGLHGMPTPISSRSNSPAPQASLARTNAKLVVDLQAFVSLVEGTQRELIDVKDQSANEHHSAGHTIDDIEFGEAQTLILEEQIQGSADFVSDKLRKTAAQNGIDLNTTTSIIGTGQNTSKPKSNATTGLSAIKKGPIPSGVMTRTNKKGKTRGVTGLANLGNTCYMNSALQCIRSVEELTLYFLAGKVKSEINQDNPLGYHGAMAKAYDGFLHSLYDTDAVPSFGPRNFKNVLGRCQPLFSGYGQQDSQEFLSFLVDGLHEDLNRVLKKPYRENPESDDKTVNDPEAIRQLGEKYRENHKARNDSIAMDLFGGFYKNTMVCPVCDKISVTFDPYSLLTLQLPIESTFQHQFIFVPLQGRPVKVNVDMDKNSNIRMLKEYVAKRFRGTRAECLVVAEHYNRKLYKVFEDAEVLSEVQIQQNDQINVYELDATPTNWPPVPKKKIKLMPKTNESKSKDEETLATETRISDRLAVPVVHRFSDRTGSDFVLQPGIILLTREEARDMETVFRKVLRSVSVLSTRDLINFDGSPTQGSDSNEGSDVVIMNVEDTSADDQQIQAKSIEGEDGFVDVTMTGTRNGKGSEGDDPNDSAESKTKKSSLLNEDNFLDPGLRSLFSLQYYTSRDDPIPCGFTTVNASDRFPSLDSRLSQPSMRRNSSNSWSGRMQDKSTPVSSDDELSRDVSPSEALAGLNDSPPSDSDEGTNTVSDSRTLGQRLGFSRRKKASPQLKKPSGQAANVASQNESLIRLGEGIMCTWSRKGFGQLFEGNTADDMRGRYTLDDVDILEDPEIEAKKLRRNARKKQGVTLAECFEETSKSEVLSEENAWFCGRCKELRRATKTLEVWTVPDILVIHLKRFSSSSRLRDKVDVFVDFPTENLDLTGKVGLPEDKSLTYDLFAVDNHYGGLGGGHYTAYAQNFFDKKWYEYNDSMVQATDAQHAVTKSAYLLFYRRRSDVPLGPPYLQQIVHQVWNGSDSSRSGEDQRRDGSYSPNGSSGSSIEAAAGANLQDDAQHPLGSAGGLESTARNALVRIDAQHLQDEELPAYSSHAYGESTGGMNDDPDNPLPGFEDHQHQQEQGGNTSGFIGPLVAQNRFNQPGGWSFASVPGGSDGTVAIAHTPAASDKANENDTMADTDSTLAGSVAGSNAPEIGDLAEDRMLDFADEPTEDDNEHFVDAGEHFQRHMDDQEDDEMYGMEAGGHGVRHVEFKTRDDEQGDSEGEVAEVRISDDDGA